MTSEISVPSPKQLVLDKKGDALAESPTKILGSSQAEPIEVD